ncbi:hypothetical protein TWF106_008592 [Orbilia oligospora]|uniref:Uncharacterized protein n=1 Tax=Orbilia oligospora TaxID=2813651 RepID=A0A7C8UPV7_ORBOL|nr:hypothetical protein TWF106_008592 [Orbilia oligospora]
MKPESDDDSLMVMTIIDDSSTDDLSSQKPAPESSPRVLTPVSSHETVISTTPPQLKVDNEENPPVQKGESATVSISEAPKAERVENVLDGFDGPKVRRLHTLSFKAWKDLTVLAETYQWTQALQPWKSIWIKKHEASFLLSGYEDWLYLSKVYGSDYQVDQLVTTLSLHCHFDGKQISRALAYGSLLQSVNAGKLGSLLVLGLEGLEARWKESVAELHLQIESLTFSTLGILSKEHKCVIQGLKKSLSFCLTSFGLLDLQSRHDEMILRASSL